MPYYVKNMMTGTTRHFFQIPLSLIGEWSTEHTKDKKRDAPTFTMDPQEGTGRSPILKFASLGVPGRSSDVACKTKIVMGCRGVGGSEPTSNFLLQTVTCMTDSATTGANTHERVN